MFLWLARPCFFWSSSSNMSDQPTLKDLAKHSNVSLMTASRAMRGVGRVNADTRRRILEAAAKLGYDRHQRGVLSSGVNASKSDHKLRILLPVFNRSHATIDGRFAKRIVQGVEDTLVNAGGQLEIVSARDVDDLLENLPRARVHGIVLRELIPVKWMRKLQKLAPVVYMISHDVQPGVDCVYFNENKSVAMIYDHLLKFGHRKFAWIMQDRSNPLANVDLNSYDLKSGFDRQAFNFTSSRYGAMRALDLGVRDSSCQHQYIVLPLPTTESGNETDCERAGEEAAKAVLELKERPTAVITGSEDIAIYLHQALTRQGLKIPEDISIVTFLSSETALKSGPRFTGIQLRFGQIGRMVPELIQRRITNPDAPYLTATIETELLKRDTVAKVPSSE